jgi:L-seryl-tRNA(Ser) seleniumtransferase
MDELHLAAGRRLAELTHNEAAYVTSGCAAGIALAVLAAITGGQPEVIARLPYDETLPRNVVIHRAHRIPYDRAIELGSGHIVEVGNVIQTFEWELTAALDENTAAVFWVAGSHLPQTTLSLKQTVAIAHARGVPVIVDAAAQLPPLENLTYSTIECGADVARFSGGKALQGPQVSGLMVGSPTLIDAVRANAAPRQRLARAMKVGKEEIAGLVAAVERYVALDHAALDTEWDEIVSIWAEGLDDLDGVQVRRRSLNEAGQPVPRLEITLDSDVARISAAALVARLWDDTPRVAVLPGLADRVYVTPDTLVSGEAMMVMERIRTVLCSARDEL